MARNRGKKPSSLYYYQDGPPESVDLDRWRLSIGAEDGGPMAELSYDDLLALPQVAQERRFVCVCNWSVRHRWEGPLLADVLAAAGAEADALEDRYLLQRSIGTPEKGHYETTIPAAPALERDAILCMRIDGEPLTLERGFPARILDFGLYGYKSTKGLAEVVLTDRFEAGHWEREKGWAKEGEIRPKRYWLVDRCEHHFAAERGEITNV